MPGSLRLAEDVHERVWHRRGLLAFQLAVAVMLVAVAVTDAVSVDAVGVLLGGEVGALGLFVVLHGARLHRHRASLLLWPVAMCSTLFALSYSAGEASTLLSSVFVLAFLFVGLSQPPARGLWLLVPAAVGFVHVIDAGMAGSLIRIPLAMLVWALVSELPARLLTELRDQRETLRTAASTDALTGLHNRLGLSGALQVLTSADAVALIDLDHFKHFNDTAGHVAGDKALADFAAALRTSSRGGDLHFRFGGEEFLVIFPRTTPAEATSVLQRLADEWERDGSMLTFSAGVVRGGERAVNIADDLLYRAKDQGRDRIVADDGVVSTASPQRS